MESRIMKRNNRSKGYPKHVTHHGGHRLVDGDIVVDIVVDDCMMGASTPAPVGEGGAGGGAVCGRIDARGGRCPWSGQLNGSTRDIPMLFGGRAARDGERPGTSSIDWRREVSASLQTSNGLRTPAAALGPKAKDGRPLLPPLRRLG